MSVRFLSETIVKGVEGHIKSNISAALLALRTERGDAKVSTEPPQSYFVYEQPVNFKTPACFVVIRDMNFQKEALKANHITGRANVTVSILVEDRDADKLALKSWRYQAALHEVLDQQNIDVTDKAKMFLIVTDAVFSPVFTADTANTTQGRFRQEVALNVEVQHRESF